MAATIHQAPQLPPRPTRIDSVLGDAVHAFQRGVSSRYADWPALSIPQHQDTEMYIEDFIELLRAFYDSETVNETRVYKIWVLIAGSHQTKLLSTGFLLVLHLYKAMGTGQLLPPKVPIEIRTILQPTPSSQAFSNLTTFWYDIANRTAIFPILVLRSPYSSRAQLLLEVLEHSLVAEGPVTALRYLRSLLPYGVLTSILRNAEDDMLANVFSAFVECWPAVDQVKGEEVGPKLEFLTLLINLLWDAPIGGHNTEPILSRFQDVFEASLRKIHQEKRPLFLWMTLAVLPQWNQAPLRLMDVVQVSEGTKSEASSAVVMLNILGFLKSNSGNSGWSYFLILNSALEHSTLPGHPDRVIHLLEKHVELSDLREWYQCERERHGILY